MAIDPPLFNNSPPGTHPVVNQSESSCISTVLGLTLPLFTLIAASGIYYYGPHLKEWHSKAFTFSCASTFTGIVFSSLFYCSESTPPIAEDRVVPLQLRNQRNAKVAESGGSVDPCNVAPKEISRQPLEGGYDYVTYELQVPKYTETEETNCLKWLFSSCTPKGQKREILEVSLEKPGNILDLLKQLSEKTIHYSVVEVNRQDEFTTLYNQPLQVRPSPVVTHTPKWFDYKDNTVGFVDFANASHFGGGWNTDHGFVQEEQIFLTFPMIPLIAYLTRNHAVLPKNHVTQRPSPFILSAGQRNMVFEENYYSRKIYPLAEVHKHIHQPPQGECNTTIGGIAGPDFRHIEPREYSNDFIKEMIETYYALCLGFKASGPTKVATAPWSCGVFGGREKTMVAVMLMGAKMADMPQIFYGYGRPDGERNNPGYSGTLLQKMQAIVDECHTPADLAHYIMGEIANGDKTWQPKP